jgi:peptidyl-tRNA hydrolase, PTH1 family
VWLVVGLGNPGRRYEGTRHNVGFRVLDRLATRWDAGPWHEGHRALLADMRHHDRRVLLVKPLTSMNRSGEAVGSAQRYHRVASAQLVVVHDDVDLPCGRLRVRRGGSAGGNRGVASLLAHVTDDGFLRIRVGVGRPGPGPVPAAWLLAAPAGDEATILGDAETRAADAADVLIDAGLQTAMNRFNRKETTHGGPPL